MDSLFTFMVFWGVWLLVPFLIDGIGSLIALVSVLAAYSRRRFQVVPPLSFYPQVSVIIPVYNNQDTLEACLASLASQDYPLDRMEILLIDNGSQDRSFEIFSRLQNVLPFPLSWHSIINQGKAWALNAGIHLSHGAYIINVDGDTCLASDAVRLVVQAMEAEPDLGAITGAVDIIPPKGGLSLMMHVVTECEFFEYLTAFHVGREQQTLLHNLYTLSGAFSVFRREVLLQTFLYSRETVTEDTDITFDLYERGAGWRIGCITRAVAYVHPVASLSALYSQRVRWQRGQLEVSARHPELMRRPFWKITGFSPARILVIDHTLAFPRVIWTFLLLVLAIFGYPLSLIVMAFLVLYLLYLGIELMWAGVAWLDANPSARKRLKDSSPMLVALPIYRMLIFWFRFSGFLHAVAEPGSWKVQDPVSLTRQGLQQIRLQIVYWIDAIRIHRPAP
jgi:biofilm PGA synthesis N-glycosyltransferase PgaC